MSKEKCEKSPGAGINSDDENYKNEHFSLD